MKKFKSKFCIGQCIHHKQFDYYGVVLGVDPKFKMSEEWYQKMANSRPPKDKPWYHVQIHGQKGLRYVAECNLELNTAIWN